MIRLINLTKKYGDKLIINKANIFIADASFAILWGKSGSGKTTVLNLIGGLEKPTEGEIVVNKKNIDKLSEKELVQYRRESVGIIFQDAYLQPQLSISDNIMLPGIFSGLPREKRIKRMSILAEKFGITSELNSLPKEVSGGQAERACIIRAIFLGPNIILADEPTNNLDDSNSKIVLDTLDLLRKQMGITIVMSTHDKNAIRYATQIFDISEGVINEIPSEKIAAFRNSGENNGS